MKAPPAPYGALALATGLLIVLVGAALSPLTSLGRRLRAEPLSLPTETAPATIPELSGAAYHPARGTILVVSDEGGLVELTPGGAPLDRFDIPGDLEAVAVHPQTGTVFLGLERAETILEYDLDTRQTIRQLRLDLRDTLEHGDLARSAPPRGSFATKASASLSDLTALAAC